MRSFVADEVPVVAPDPVAEGFFWLAGQGGYGVMLAPILAAGLAGLIAHGRLPETFAAAGVDQAALGIERLRRPSPP